MHSHDEIEILDDAVGAIAVDPHHVFLAKQTEGAGDDQVSAETVPSQTAEEKRAQVFDHLNPGDHLPRDPGVRHPAVFHRAVVGHAHRAPYRGDLAAEQERARQPEERVGLDKRIGIHRDHEREARRVDRRVQRIGLAARA